VESYEPNSRTLELPLFPAGVPLTTPEVAFQCREGKATYVHGHLPVFQHDEKDPSSFRLFSSQWVINGTVRQVDITSQIGEPQPGLYFPMNTGLMWRSKRFSVTFLAIVFFATERRSK